MRAWTSSIPRLARVRATQRTYSCSSSSSANANASGPKVGQPASSTGSSSSAATTSGSKLRLAMNARKLLGAGGVDGSGRLAMRREHIWAAHHGRKSVSGVGKSGSRAIDRAQGFTSAAAAFIADPNAFRPVHLYQPQFALHASFTPAHMPLPVHLGIQTYFKPDKRMRDAEMFAPNDEAKRVKAVENIVKVAEHGTTTTTAVHRKRMTNLREHLATVANFSTHPDLADLLDPNPTHAKSIEIAFDNAQDQTTVFDGFVLDGFYANDFGPSSEFNRTTTFDEMVQVRLNGQTAEPTAELSPVQQADLAWETVLEKMKAATAPPPPPSATPATTPEQTLTLTTAVSEVESLLASLGLSPSTTDSLPVRSFIRGTSSRRMGRVAQRAFRPSRVSLVGVDLMVDEMVWMDSVKRKRQKKISKHKYKKRRKATRAERKKLGK